MSKGKIDVLFFNPNALILTESEKRITGELYLEKRPRGKFLCFKKADVVTAIPLTKKMYKNLNRFTSSVRLERFYDIEAEIAGEDVEDELTEEDVYYIMSGKHLNSGKREYNQPTIMHTPGKIKEKMPFVVQVFKYVSHR